MRKIVGFWCFCWLTLLFSVVVVGATEKNYENKILISGDGSINILATNKIGIDIIKNRAELIEAYNNPNTVVPVWQDQEEYYVDWHDPFHIKKTQISESGIVYNSEEGNFNVKLFSSINKKTETMFFWFPVLSIMAIFPMVGISILNKYKSGNECFTIMVISLVAIIICLICYSDEAVYMGLIHESLNFVNMLLIACFAIVSVRSTIDEDESQHFFRGLFYVLLFTPFVFIYT